jgi:hypothetical protein
MPPGNRRNATSDITIVGAGMAGLAAAFRALEAGRRVTLIEGSSLIGGKFGAVYENGMFYEVAYHFFADWCLNFWDLIAEIGLDKSRDFVELPAVTFIEPGGRRSTLQILGGPTRFWSGVHCGVLPWPDMFAYLYSTAELLADEGFSDEQEFLNRVSVNGYMRSKPYMTDAAALLHNETLLKVFAIPSYETSARAYRRLLQLMAYANPAFRALKGNCYTRLLAPLKTHMEQRFRGRFELRLDTRIESISFDARRDRVRSIAVDTPRGRDVIRVKQLILAVPHQQVATLLERNADLRERLPELSDLRLLRAKQMASLDLIFKKKIAGIPEGHVTLLDRTALRAGPTPRKNAISSDYALSFIDNSVIWGEPRTHLSITASDFDGLAGVPAAEARMAVFRTIQRYLDFDESLVDWSQSCFQRNAHRPLFINTVGSWESRPEIRPDRMSAPGISNLFLAGDYCRSAIDMPSVEGAIVTGEMAAWRATGRKSRFPREPIAGGQTPDEWEQTQRTLEPWMSLLRAKGPLPSAPPPKLQEALGKVGSAMSISPATAAARPA